MIKVFLTGALGTIGSGILQSLLRAGYKVTCPVLPSLNITLVKDLYQDQVTFIPLDLDSELFTQYELLASDFCFIIHSGYTCDESDTHIEHAVISGLLSAARKTSLSQTVTFVLSTASLVLEETDNLTGEDDVNTINGPQICKYRVAHEDLAINAQSENLHISIVRPTWVYGVSFVDKWFKACKMYGKIVVPEGNGKVSFIHREDLGDLFRLILENKATGFFAGSEGLGLDTTEIIELAKRVTGVNEVIRVRTVDQYIEKYDCFLYAMMFRSWLDCKRGREILGFIPKYNFARDAERVLEL